MKKDKLPSPKDFFKHKEILKLAARQIEKDFAMFSLSIEFDENEKDYFKSICTQINSLVQKEIHGNQNNLMSLLYQIDVSENRIKTYMQQHQDIEMQEVLTQLIVEREIQKVITKIYYGEDLKKKALLLGKT